MKKTYDFLIIGGGFSGLLTALCLQKKGYTTCLIEKSSHIGRDLKSSDNIFEWEQTFSLFFNTDNTHHALNFLGDLLEEKISYRVEKLSPLIFSRGQVLKASKQNEVKTQGLSFYTQDERLILEQYPQDWLSKALALYSGDILSETQVVNVQQANQKIISCQSHDGKETFAKQFMMCLSLHSLEMLFKNNPSLLSHHKYKVKTWTKVCVDFVHPQKITDTQALHLLWPSPTAKQKTAVLGLFHPFQDERQHSQWLAFLASSTPQDEEKVIEHILKAIKKNLKKIYPQSLNHLLFEKLLIAREHEYTFPKKYDKSSILKCCENASVIMVNKNPASYHQHFIDHLQILQPLISQF